MLYWFSVPVGNRVTSTRRGRAAAQTPTPEQSVGDGGSHLKEDGARTTRSTRPHPRSFVPLATRYANHRMRKPHRTRRRNASRRTRTARDRWQTAYREQAPAVRGDGVLRLQRTIISLICLRVVLDEDALAACGWSIVRVTLRVG